MLAKVCRRPEGPGIVAADLAVLPEGLCQLYFLSNLAYWSRDLYFEVPVWERQNWLVWSHDVELFSMRTSKRPRYCFFRIGGGSTKYESCCMC